MNIFFAFLALVPLQAMAFVPPRNFSEFVFVLVDLIQLLVVLIFALTFIVLIWAIVNTWILKGGEQESVEKGKKVVTTGVIVLVIMLGVWGIIELLRAGIFGLY